MGMKQTEQKKVLADFRAGNFNTLVATCIAEEGLDIAEASISFLVPAPLVWHTALDHCNAEL